jgi:hypothetical protein
MYMLQAHMLQHMFIDDPRWARLKAEPGADTVEATACAMPA